MNLIDAIKETGKARRKSWKNEKYHVIINHERSAFQAKDAGGPYWIDMVFENFMAEDWEPYKEPCQHEPDDIEFRNFHEYGVFNPKTLGYEFKKSPITTVSTFAKTCKHCGVRIKAEKWVENK